MAETWVTPKTWSYKEAPGSDSLNEQIRDNLNYVKESLPAGIIIGYGGAAAPDQWFLCDGTAVSRSTYSALFTAIGVSYGVGNGSSTFNLPDYRGRVMVGLSSTDADFDTLGEKYGSKTVSVAHVHAGPSHAHTGPSHNHSIPNNGLLFHLGGGGYSNSIGVDDGVNAINDHNHGGTTGSGGTGNTGSSGTGNTGAMSANATPSIVQPGQVSNFIIKY